MNIQLFLENKEVELNSKLNFPLNKTYENLINPTDIVVDYSKSINIPATANNNRLMANAYRFDRNFISNENQNIGLYLDPLKRIPMKLVYNTHILLEGYAKYVSATTDANTTYYTFNLFGAIGDVFQKLFECVFDENKLTEEQRAEEDGGQKYIIETPWRSELINKDLIKRSWDTTDIKFDTAIEEDPCYSIGFAPAYRGKYDNFESDSILPSVLEADGAVSEPWKIEEYLKKRWKTNLVNDRDYTPEDAQAHVDAINFDMILPNGVDEHSIRQFRSYEQKPYIYFRALMQMYQKKCKELTGYEITLDPSWFSINNPYWTRLCYMLDYLSVRGNTLQTSQPFTGYNENGWDNSNLVRTISYTIDDEKILSQNTITTLPFTLCIQNKYTPFSSDAEPEKYGKVGLNKNVEILVDITTTTNGNDHHTYFWGGVDYATAGSNSPTKYKKDNFITVSEQTTYESNTNKLVGKTFLTIPSFSIPHTSGDDLKISYKISINKHYVSGSSYSFNYSYDGTHRTYIYPSANSSDFIVIIPNTQYKTNWRNNTTCEMKNLYAKEDSLFKVILQYTKIFGLIWDADYNNKTINITTRQSYFKNYKIEDWNDKIDKSKGLTIEPVSFNSKYISFNYEDLEGYRYSGYKSKYGVDYGEKRMKTKYNFNINTTNLFNDKIYPSSASCKSYIPFVNLTSWDTITTLAPIQSEIDFIDSENDDQSSAIQVNNFYFRLPNYKSESYYKISDISDFENNLDKYFWLTNLRLEGSSIAVNTQTLPQFSPVYKSDEEGNLIGTPLGCLFNTPNEDYTKNKLITEAAGNYIYDICWSDYIAERYNAGNKKVTCYVRMSIEEYNKFKFNTFVVVSNQLFMVNKFIDYDINGKYAQVELIQISNIEGYTERRLSFPAITYDKSEIYIETREGTAPTSSISFTSYPLIEYDEYEIRKVNVTSSNSHCWVEDVETFDNIRKVLYITYEADGDYNEEWELVVNALGETITIPIYVNYN